MRWVVSPSISALGDMVTRCRSTGKAEFGVVRDDEIPPLQYRESADGGRQHVGGAGRGAHLDRGMLRVTRVRVDDVVDQGSDRRT